MGNSSNFRDVYSQQQIDSHVFDNGDVSTGIVRENSRRRENGLELSFDRLEAEVSNDIIEQIRRESKIIKLKPREMIKEIQKLTVSFAKKEGDEDPDSSGNCCSVCLVPFENGDSTVPLPCNATHVFHKECVLSWA